MQPIFGQLLPSKIEQTQKLEKNHPNPIYLNEKNHSFDRLRIQPF